MSSIPLSELMMARRMQAQNAAPLNEWVRQQSGKAVSDRERELMELEMWAAEQERARAGARHGITPPALEPKDQLSPPASIPPAGVSPDMVLRNGVYTTDPANLNRVEPAVSPEQIVESGRQLIGMSAQVPGWRHAGAASRVEGSTLIDPNGARIDLTDTEAVAKYSDWLMDRVAPAATTKPPAPDVVEGLVLKARDADPAASDYMQFPRSVYETYGIPGVNFGALSVGEKLTLRRMGVQLPTPTPRRRKRRG